MCSNSQGYYGDNGSLSLAAQAVKRDIAQIMQELSQRCRVSISATDTLPITLETNDTSLEAGINALCAAALRAAADHIAIESIWHGHPEHTGVRWAAERLRIIADELEGPG